ncbi:MAG TPA: beta-propeller fold lactonase family protein [Solirubrobacteraceae bacterium]|jgi:hypothetical protein
MRTDGKWRRMILAPVIGLLVAAPAAEADGGPQLAVQGNGLAHIGWTGAAGDRSALFERTRTATGTLSDAQYVSSASADVTGTADVAVDRSGNALYAWTRSVYGDSIQVRRRAADGALSAMQTLSPSTRSSSEPDLALDSSGNAVVAWQAIESGGGSQIQIRRRSSTGVLGAVQTLSATGNRSIDPDVALDSNGNAVVIWERDTLNGSAEVIEARRIASDGTLGPVVPLSTGRYVDSPRVGMDANGNAILAWIDSDGTRSIPKLKRRSAEGAFSATQPLTSSGDARALELAVSPLGAAIATWFRVADSYQIVRARRRASDGTLGAVLDLTPATAGHRCSFPDVAMDPHGNAVFFWQTTDNFGPQRVQARRRAAGGALSSIEDIAVASGEDDDVRGDVKLDANGNAVLAWTHLDVDADANYTVSVQVRRRVPTGELSPIQTVSP